MGDQVKKISQYNIPQTYWNKLIEHLQAFQNINEEDLYEKKRMHQVILDDFNLIIGLYIATKAHAKEIGKDTESKEDDANFSKTHHYFVYNRNTWLYTLAKNYVNIKFKPKDLNSNQDITYTVNRVFMGFLNTIRNAR